MKKIFSFILLLLVFCPSRMIAQSTEIDTMKLCDRFVKNYKSTLIHNGDTLVVSRITQPDSLVNNFFLNCAKNKDFRPVKYAFVIIYKQSIEYSKKYKSDYIVHEEGLDNLYEQNGFVALILAFIRKHKIYGNEDFVLFTNDIYEIMIKYRKNIPDYKYIEKHIKKKISK